MTDNTQTLVRVAQLYYLRGLTQAKIAEELNVSRSLVSLMLAQAKERGMVEVSYTIKNPRGSHDEYSQRLTEIFGVKDCVVVPSCTDDYILATKLVASSACDYFNSHVNSGDIVGFTWGLTCSEFLTDLEPRKGLEGLSIVPTTGSSHMVSPSLQTNEMVRLFAYKSNWIHNFIFAPCHAVSPEEKELYMQTSQMRDIQRLWDNMNVVLAGVGVPPDSPNILERDITPDLVRSFEDNPERPALDICGIEINVRGEVLNNPKNQCLIGVCPGQLEKAELVLGMAAGARKAISIMGALRSGFIDTFITDEKTAELVIMAEAISQQLKGG